MSVDVGVIGATGLVGQEMLRILEERAFPVGTLRAYASPRSEGRPLPFAGGEVTCEVLRDGCFDGLDLVIVDVDDPLALEWAPVAAAAGARVRRQLGRVPHGVRRPARGRRGEPRGPRAPAARDRVVPQLHDDGPRHRARRRCRRPRASSAWSCPPTSRCPARARPASPSSRSSGASSPATPTRCGVPARSTASSSPGAVWSKPIAGNVIPLAGSVKAAGLHERGVEARVREPQDPPRRHDAHHRHVRTRAGVRRPRDVAPTCSSATR